MRRLLGRTILLERASLAKRLARIDFDLASATAGRISCVWVFGRLAQELALANAIAAQCCTWLTV